MDYYFRPDSFFQVDLSPANCSGDPHRSSCQLLESEVRLYLIDQATCRSTCMLESLA